MLNITIKSIPHKEQRCDGNCGDYWLENNGRELQIRVSELGDWRMEFLVALHEMIEFHLCHQKGIKEGDIQAFDEEFYRQQALGVHPKELEAGMHKDAPYHFQHIIADSIERTIGALMEVDQKEYDEAMENIDVPKGF